MKGLFKNLIYTALLALVACSSATQDDKPKLCVSIEPQRKILEEIVGDRYEVVSMLANGANPETYDPTMSQRVEADKALAYFTTGYMPFELTLANSLSGNTMIVNTSYGIVPVTGTHSHAHDDAHADADEGVDPHVWTSVRNAKQIALNMAEAMAKIDPVNKNAYLERYTTLSQRLDSLDNDIAQRLDAAGTHAFAIWHPSLSYYARDYGLHQLAAGTEGKDLSVGAMREIIDEAREDSVKVFFFQREFDTRQAESMNKAIGSRLVTINPLSYDWDNELITITDELTR